VGEAVAEPDAEGGGGVGGDGDGDEALPAHRPLVDRLAPLLTHGSLAALTILLYWLVVRFGFSPPVIIACAVIQHRIGILLHEYIHGIPFRLQKHNQWVMSLFDPLMCAFGLLHVFRGSHLAHHRWLNTERDPAHQSAQRTAGNRSLGLLAALELPQHLHYLRDAVLGRQAFAARGRIVAGFVTSVAWVATWSAYGYARVPVTVFLLSVYNAVVSSSLRGAVEHQSVDSDPMFANEYRSFVPLFNINRHIHHHLDPRCPWYRLRFIGEPLPPYAFVTHWWRTYVTKELVLMKPQRGPAAEALRADALKRVR
jgi:fatty acid desaturase